MVHLHKADWREYEPEKYWMILRLLEETRDSTLEIASGVIRPVNCCSKDEMEV